MSWVSNVLLSVDFDDEPTVNVFNKWLGSEAPRRYESSAKGVGFLGDLTANEALGWGGSKFPECQVWGGAVKDADLNSLVAKFAALPWQVPAAAQLFVMDQEQTYFRLWMLRDGQAA